MKSSYVESNERENNIERKENYKKIIKITYLVLTFLIFKNITTFSSLILARTFKKQLTFIFHLV